MNASRQVHNSTDPLQCGLPIGGGQYIANMHRYNTTWQNGISFSDSCHHTYGFIV
jgi:hypothetical protein